MASANDPASVEAQLRSSYPELGPALASLSPPAGVLLKYGTAGFRARAELLEKRQLRAFERSLVQLRVTPCELCVIEHGTIDFRAEHARATKVNARKVELRHVLP